MSHTAPGERRKQEDETERNAVVGRSLQSGRTATYLLLGGAISAAFYAALALLFPLPWYAAQRRLYDLPSLTPDNAWGAALYGIPVAALFAGYWLCWRRLRAAEVEGELDSRPLLAIILIFAALYAAALIWIYPLNAIDLFQYFFRSRVWTVYGGDPFSAMPAQFPGDPYLYTVGEYKEVGSLYGPAWELLAAAAARLSGGALIPNLLALKGLAALFYAGSVVLLYLILARAAPRQRISGTLLLAWNPLILLEWVGNGHNDVVMMCFLLLGTWLWTRRWYAWVMPALVVAALCKAIAAVAMPVFLLAMWAACPGWRARLRWLAPAAALSVLVATALCAPFGLPWQNVGSIVAKTAGRYSFSLSATLMLIGDRWAIPSVDRYLALPPGSLQAIYQWAYAVPRWLALGALAIVYVRQLRMVWRQRQDAIAGATEALFAVAMLVPSYRMWYPTWSMSLAACCPKSERLLRIGVASLAAALSPLIYGYMDQWSILARYLVGTGSTLVLPLLLPVAMRGLETARVSESP